MQDLTQGSVTRHLLNLSAFMALSMGVQTLYILVDLYWVGRLGREAIAAVALSSNLMFVTLALTQAIGIGATALLAQAAGRKDQPAAEHIFNQAASLGVTAGIAFAIAAFVLRDAYVGWLAADATTARLAVEYLNWIIPAFASQFVLVPLGAALRGTGVVKAPTLIQVGTVVVNMVLAPVFMFGWLGAPRMGVAGTAFATLLALLAACVAYFWYFETKYHYVRFRRREMRPERGSWRKILGIGTPAGAEFLLMAAYMILVFDVIQPFGAAAQAAFGVGGRVLQAVFLPVVAIGFSVAPVVGQNFGARRPERVRRAFWSSAATATAYMVLLTAVFHLFPEALVRPFTKDPQVIGIAVEYLNIISWNLVFSGLVFTSSSAFQGLGNTVPPLVTSFTRVGLFAVAAYALAAGGRFTLPQVWWISVASVVIQAIANVVLLQREMDRKLHYAPIPAVGPA